MYLCCPLTTPLKRAVTNLLTSKYMLTKIKQLAKNVTQKTSEFTSGANNFPKLK